MTFTDNEVARLREKCTNRTGKFYTTIDFDRGIALLDRLAAAEERIRTTSQWLDNPSDEGLLKMAREADKTWRKAAGK